MKPGDKLSVEAVYNIANTIREIDSGQISFRHVRCGAVKIIRVDIDGVKQWIVSEVEKPD